jgi:tetratricopeptide (TPR) repeat protein
MRFRPARKNGITGQLSGSGQPWVVAAICLGSFLSIAPVLAASFSARTSTAVTAGNEAYQRGDFAAAEQHYRRALEGGATGTTVLYNLGNACFKQKKLGEAIYWWERAKRLDPEDPDIRENLEFARLLVADRIEVPPDPFPVRVLRGATRLLPERAECWTLAFLLAAANGCFTLWLFTDRRRLAAAALVGIVVALVAGSLVGASLTWKIVERNSSREGVVIEQKVEVRSGPGEENTVLFSLHEGIVVRIRSAAGPWLQVSLPNGWNGWLRADAVKQ